ncbi:dcm: DNA (cytosine-5-)-methyltransferase [Solimicrobium silvestre]|uniref:Cytosine-specific methyltransferase n=2 Tax=Solimicrobium silvestre TaxID=2099400 RepID=A0A2S9H347_9BURK|nr:dcm: DNA (cytosine-5-)-methyltransferase [Solimicrobium silvestre]
MDYVLETSDHDEAMSYLALARAKFTQTEIARHLKVDSRTVRRWEARQSSPQPYITAALKQLMLPIHRIPEPSDEFKFIDLFAGVGGIRHGFQAVGGQCVFTSEWNTYAQKTYETNYPDEHKIDGDITLIDEEDVPDHDVLLAGFPCQPFSIAGVSKKNSLGRSHGFADETQGTLFFDVARIIAAKRPRAFLLENVKNLLSHDKGRTFDVIKRTLSEELGYHIHYKVIDGAHYVPQHRERIIIVGFREPVAFDWNMLNLPEKNQIKLQSILHKTDGSEPVLAWDENKYFDHQQRCVPAKYTLTDNLWTYLQNYAAKHREKGNGFGYGMAYPDSITRTLSARYHKDGSEILVYQGEKKNPRRLTPRECARLMGYPDTFLIPVSDTRAYQQFGNSVVVNVISEIARIMKPFICENEMQYPEFPELIAN